MPTINEILEFAGSADALSVLGHDAYVSDAGRVSGHGYGLARLELENTVLRNLSRFARGLAQFIAERYPAGVVDDGDMTKIVTGMGAAIMDLVSDSMPPATVAEGKAGVDPVPYISPAVLSAVIIGVTRRYTLPQGPVPQKRTGGGTQGVDLATVQELWLTATSATTMANPTNMQEGMPFILDVWSANAQTLSWGSSWIRNGYTSLPTSSVAGKRLRLPFVCTADGSTGTLRMMLLSKVLEA